MPGTHPELRFLLRSLLPYRRALFAATVLLLAGSLVTLSMPWFAGEVAAALLNAQDPGWLLLAWLAAMTVQAALACGNGLVLGSANAHVTADLGSRVYDHLQTLPIRWHQDRKRGEILTLLTSDVRRIGDFSTGILPPLLPSLFTCLGALFLLVRIQPWIGIVVAVAVPIRVLLMKLLTRQLRPLAAANLREDAIKFGIAEQNLSTLSIIKAFTRESGEAGRYAAQGNRVRDLEIRQLRIESLLAPVIRWLGATTVLGLIWLGSHGVASGAISAPELVTMLLYGLLLTQPVGQLAAAYGQSKMAQGSAFRLMEVFSESPEPDSGRRELTNVQGELRFEAVSYAHPGRRALLVGLDLHIRPGETVAITGANGAGKSTLAHLILRFMDPDAGHVLLDGVDLRILSLRHLREQVGFVGQNVVLLNATVAENIGFGRAGATLEQIERAAQAAHAHEFILLLPAGYDTVIGDEGLRLSGGQRQRIALARALLKDPPILILDEATSMFDPQGEADFIAEWELALRSKTVILITHRQSSLALADRVYVLEEGRLRPQAPTGLARAECD